MSNIYLDNAASSPMDPEVWEIMKPYLCDYMGNPSSTHSHGRALRAEIEKSRRTIAELLGASPSEIFFTSGGTEADNTAIYGAVESYDITHIISTEIEHHAVSHAIDHLVDKGKVKVSNLSVNAEGHIDHEELRKCLSQNPKSLVCLMHGNNEIGTLSDLNAIGNICAEYDAIFMSDTVQTIGHVKHNLSQIPLHFATASAHKFYGPKGVGILYIKKGTQIPSYIVGGGQERNMRAGTENIASISGMAFALNKCYSTLDQKNLHLRNLQTYMKDQLKSRYPEILFNGDQRSENSLPTILNVTFPQFTADALLLFNLDLMGISVSGGSACNSGAVAGSHVLAKIGRTPLESVNSVRFSFGTQNTFEEIDSTIEKLEEILTSVKA